MAVQYKNGNLVDALLEGDVDYIAHVCNNKKVMGSGLAKEIKERIPAAFSAYNHDHLQWMGVVTDASGVFNMIAQDGYGRDKRHLNYGYLSICLHTVFNFIDDTHTLEGLCKPKLGVAYKMGADRAGGDWTIISEMLEAMAEYYCVDVICYKL